MGIYENVLEYVKSRPYYKSSRKIRKIHKKISDDIFKRRISDFFFECNLVKLMKNRLEKKKLFLTEAVFKLLKNKKLAENDIFELDISKLELSLRVHTIIKIYEQFKENIGLMKVSLMRYEKFKKGQAKFILQNKIGLYLKKKGMNLSVKPLSGFEKVKKEFELRWKSIINRYIDPRKRLKMNYEAMDMLAIVFTIFQDYGCKIGHLKF